jgi:hypothetical protein
MYEEPSWLKLVAFHALACLADAAFDGGDTDGPRTWRARIEGIAALAVLVALWFLILWPILFVLEWRQDRADRRKLARLLGSKPLPPRSHPGIAGIMPTSAEVTAA